MYEKDHLRKRLLEVKFQLIISYYLRKFSWQEYYKHSSRGDLIQRCSQNMQQIYRRTYIRKRGFHKIAKQLFRNYTFALVFSYKFATYFQNIFRTPLYKNTFEELLLKNLVSGRVSFFNWDSLHARLNSHYKAWSYKKKKHKKSCSIQEIYLERTYS